jgi:UDP-glucose 4-epimerase
VLNSEKALVLGANGFIGSHVVDSLVDKGYKVRAFDSFNSGETRFNLSDQIELYSGNFLNRTDIREALDGVDYVFHLVSTTTPATAEADPIIDIETNIQGSVSLFQDCVAAGGIKRVVYSSSGGTVYGERETGAPMTEDEPLLPVSPYGIGKVTVENYLRYFRVKHGLESTTFRIANPYGERQPRIRKQGVIPIFLDKVISDEPITVLGDGSMVRDYIYVKDVADMMVSTLNQMPEHSVYNLGSGEGHSLNDIIESIETVTNKKPTIERKEVPKTFLHTSVLSTNRYFNEFGGKNMMSLPEGIKATYDYISRDIQNNGQ